MRAIEGLLYIRVLLPDLLRKVLYGFWGWWLVSGSTLADAIKL